MRVLIQKRAGEIATSNGHSAYIGFRERGHEIGFFEVDTFESQLLTKDTLVVGGVPIVMRALQRLGVPFPSLPSIPESLLKFAKRKIWVSTIREVRLLVDTGTPVFLKPAAEKLKQFSGHVARNFADLAITAALDENTPVVCAEPLDMVSEYRAYVIKGEIVGCK